MPLRCKTALDLFVILDDAVVDEPDIALAVGVRMGIQLGYAAVRRPARVNDAERPLGLRVPRFFFEIRDAADRFLGVHLRALPTGRQAVHDRESCRVVAAIFERFDAIEKDGECPLFADIAHDAAHSIPILCRFTPLNKERPPTVRSGAIASH